MADDDGPLSIIPSPCDPLHIAQAFALAEFSALRSESDASRTATHSIFSWSLASLSALSTGVGFLITQLDQSSSTQVRFIVYGALAFTLPAIALFSCLAW